MPFRIITAAKDAEYYSCICESCGHSPEPISRGKDWASTVDEEVKRSLRARGWVIDDSNMSWCVACRPKTAVA